MGLLLKQIFQFIKLLNSENGTNQIAAGIAAGFVLGMTPALSLQTILVFVCIFFFRIQAGAAMVSAGFFAFAAFLLDPVFDQVGRVILEIGGLQGLFTTLYNMPIIPFTRFNNTIVMGSGVVSITLAPVIFVLARILVAKYRETVLERFKQTKIWKAVKATSFYKWYYKYDELYR
ncbi:MAG: TIGR03546 family protein [Bdellovibrionaceae bacterium]|nr:TIGR03546 family protein [Bdellovibrionales bacterium]MCB9084604.1 TIGR03546 family protein [Pseudobdellovibrionaceae bacterium]